ncbi:allophanate hydrolase subunit 1 [Agromyces sp. SYSU K20354]|uniref:5-oxoprolinase subunit B family protein n=1 Tax=Agromyces cavernae TaxID=2898659 RepID=UPI001E325354|nr:allophanate hydrolase subunit 1 [Agromyces cavernae]MCD2441615.1 allophanate hydrolase subunit 1 [Agromyces cavernae]
MSRRLLPSGESAVLVECDSLDEVLALHDALAADRRPGVVELVPAARTVLVGVDADQLPLESAMTWIRRIPLAVPTAGRQGAGDAATIRVVYDGDDLAATARLLGITTEALVAAHQAADWRVAFAGFAPGFGYLVCDDWPYQVPRLDAPRTRVPAGAVALAGAFAGVYPRQSPGGWRLIGRTDAVLWDAQADPPALLAPGRRVRFEAAV